MVRFGALSGMFVGFVPIVACSGVMPRLSPNMKNSCWALSVGGQDFRALFNLFSSQDGHTPMTLSTGFTDENGWGPGQHPLPGFSGEQAALQTTTGTPEYLGDGLWALSSMP